jgi:hypothetical protein
MLNNHKVFEIYFFDLMIQLADDKIVNVRIALAQTVKRHKASQGPLHIHPKLISLIQKLKGDGE